MDSIFRTKKETNTFLKFEHEFNHDKTREGKNEDFLLFQTTFYLTPKVVEKKRSVQDIVSILSSVGGLLKLIQSVFSVITYPVSKFLFILVMIKKLYFARTNKQSVFHDEKYSKKSEYSMYCRSAFLNFDNLPCEL